MNQAEESQTRVGTDRSSPPGTPRWVKVFGIITAVLILLFVGLQFIGGGHGPGRHLPSASGDTPPIEHTTEHNGQ